jgi:hypothetical protein
MRLLDLVSHSHSGAGGQKAAGVAGLALLWEFEDTFWNRVGASGGEPHIVIWDLINS